MKLKKVLFIAIAILTIGLFVACNDDVVAGKDNSLSYTQVLESNGAFEYNGTKYETLQDAINAVPKGNAMDVDPNHVIKLVGEGVKVGDTTVPSNTYAVLDLNGKSLSFLGVNGVTVSGLFGILGDGEVTLTNENAEATVITVAKGGWFATKDTKFSVAGQYAVKASGTGAKVNLSEDAVVEGIISAEDSAVVILKDGPEVSGTMYVSSGASMEIYSDEVKGPIVVSDATVNLGSNIALDEDTPIAMKGSSILSVSDGAAAYISEFDNGNSTIVCAIGDESAITTAPGVVLSEDDFAHGFCYVVASGNERIYFSDLSEAVDAAAGCGGTVYYVLDHDDAGVTYILDSSATIEMGSFTEDTKVQVNSGKTLTVNGGTFTNTVDGNGTIVATGTTFAAVGFTAYEPAVVSKNCTFNGDVLVTSIIDGTYDATATPKYADGSTFKKSITVIGVLNTTAQTATFRASTINNAVNEGVVLVADKAGFYNSTVTTLGIAGTATLTGYDASASVTIDDSTLTAEGLIAKEVSINKTTISYATDPEDNLVICGGVTNNNNTYPTLTPSDSVFISDTAGTIARIYVGTGNTPEGQVALTVGYEDVSASLTIGSIVSDYDVALTGPAPSSNSSEDVLTVGNITSKDLMADLVTLTGDVEATGIVSFTNSVFNGTDIAISTSSADDTSGTSPVAAINIATSTGTIDSISATGNGSIKLTTVTGTIGDISTSNETVSEGTSGTIVIDNEASEATLTTGILTAWRKTSDNPANYVYGDVTVTGGTYTPATDPVVDYRVTVGGITGENVTTQNSIVTGAVSASGNIRDGIMSGTSYVNGSTFQGTLSADGTITLYSSTFAPTITSGNDHFVYSKDGITMKCVAFGSSGYVGVWATNCGFVSMTNVTGTAASVIATNISDATALGTITIDNSTLTSGSFTVTGEVASRVTVGSNVYHNNVTIYGCSGHTVSVGSIDGKVVGVNYVNVTEGVSATDNITSTNSTFEGAVTAGTYITDGTNSGTTYANGSTFEADIRATLAVFLNNSITKSNVSSDLVIEAHNATLGDSASDDSLYAPVIVVDDSQVKALRIMGNYTSNTETAAKRISLTNLRGASGITRVLGAYDTSSTYSNNYVVYITKASGSLTLGNASNGIEATGGSGVNAIYIAETETDTTTTGMITINGVVTGNGAASVKILGNAKHVATTSKPVTSGGSITVEYVTANSTLSATGNIITKNSTFNDIVSADGSITDGTTGTTYADGSTFNANIDADAGIVLYASKFGGTTAPTVTSPSAGSIAMYNCTGTVGAISSYNSTSTYAAGSITINNSGVSGDLSITGAITSNDGTAYNDVAITAPSNGTNKITIEGRITGRYIGMSSIQSDSSLIVKGISGHEFYANGKSTIYGGTYGTENGDSILFDGGLTIHKGVFNVTGETELQQIVEHISGEENYPVVINVSSNTSAMILSSPLVFGDEGSYYVYANKPITLNANNSLLTITGKYFYNTGYSWPVVVRSGKITFNRVKLAIAYNTTDSYTSNYADNKAMWYYYGHSSYEFTGSSSAGADSIHVVY